MCGLYVLNDLGYYVDISIVIKYFSIYTVLIKWLVAYKCDYRSHIKQVIISCEFCQHFNCLEVVLGSWMSLWYLDILGYVDWVLNPLEKLLFYEMDFEIYVFKNWLRNMVIEVFLNFRLELMN